MKTIATILLLLVVNAQYSPEEANFVKPDNFKVINSMKVNRLNNSLIIAGQSSGSAAIISSFSYYGIPIWSQVFGLGSGEAYNGVEIDETTGYIYALGTTGSEIMPTLSYTSYISTIICKYSPDGTLIWSKAFGPGTIQAALKLVLDPFSQSLVALTTIDNIGSLTTLDLDGNILQTYYNDSITQSIIQVNPDIPNYQYRDAVTFQNVTFVVGEVFVHSLTSLYLACFDKSYNLLWDQIISPRSYAIGYGITFDPKRPEIIFISGTTTTNLYEASYNYEDVTGGNGFLMAYNSTSRTHIWVKQWDRGIPKVQMAAIEADYYNGLIYMAEYALSRGPSFITTYSSNGSVQNSLQIRYAGWQFVSAQDLALVPETGLGYMVGSFGKVSLDTGFLLAFNLNNSYGSKMKARAFGNSWAATIPVDEPVETIYDGSKNEFSSTIKLSGGTIAGIVFGNVILLVGSVFGVFLVGRHYHIKALKAKIMADRLKMSNMGIPESEPFKENNEDLGFDPQLNEIIAQTTLTVETTVPVTVTDT